MGALELQQIRSIDELRAIAGDWDDLWWRSDLTSPLARAEIVAQWLEHFAPRATFRALVVRDGSQLIAALPLFGQRWCKLCTVGRLPSNDWSHCGELLFDSTADASAALDRLITGFTRLPWSLVRLSPVERWMPRWQAFLAAAERAGCMHAEHDHYRVGRVAIGRDWNAYVQAMSGNHRRYLRKAERRAAQDGALKLCAHEALLPEAVEPLVRLGFAIEDRSWKGAEGTSVLRAPGMIDWYLRHARQLAAWGQLRLTFLELSGRPMAFEFGYHAKQTYFTPKVGFDEAFKTYSPSQLLRARLFEQLHAADDTLAVDFCGPLSDATWKWTTSEYALGRIAVAAPSLAGRCMYTAYRSAARLTHWRLRLQERRRRPRHLEPGAPLPMESSETEEAIA